MPAMPATETEARARRLPPVLVGIGMAGGMPVAKLSEDETKALIACLNSLK